MTGVARQLPWRVRLIDLVARTGAVSVADLDHDAIADIRARVSRNRLPLAWLTGPVPATVRINAVEAAAPDGRTVGVRLYRPRLHRRLRQPQPDALPILIFVHGGGWVLGSVAGYDPLAGYLSESLGALVASIDYRLAPHDPAPAALDDVLAATRWVWEHAAQLGGDGARMAICGDSAGGNLATVAAQRFRDDLEAGRDAPRLRHQALLYPAVDATRLTASKMEFAQGPVLTRRDTDAYLRHYLGADDGALHAYDPRVSPALGRLDGLPPTLIQVAEFDPLRDEGLTYAQDLSSAGVPVVCTTYRGAVHGFASFPGASREGFSHRDELSREIGRHLLGVGSPEDRP